MADVSQVYKKIWSGPEANAAKEAASNLYSNAAAQSGLGSCDRGAVTYGSNGGAESINVGTLRQCGISFGKEVSKNSRK